MYIYNILQIVRYLLMQQLKIFNFCCEITETYLLKINLSPLMLQIFHDISVAATLVCESYVHKESTVYEITPLPLTTNCFTSNIPSCYGFPVFLFITIRRTSCVCNLQIEIHATCITFYIPSAILKTALRES